MVNSKLVKAANQLIPKADNRSLPTIPNGGTQDIVNEVISVYALCKNDLEAFAQVLKGETVYETCSNIWHFIKKNIRYKEDPPGVQWIKTPARIWQDRVCDCKGYSIFTACLLHALSIKGKFRFVSYEKHDKTVTHVYVIIPGKKTITIDCVMPEYNLEKGYAHKKDYEMTQISRLSGIGCAGNPDCDCGNPCGQKSIFQMPSQPQTSTQMALTSAVYKPNLNLTPEALADNLLLLERLKIEMGIESRQDNWNDIRLAMYQEAIARVNAKIEILESTDAKINGGLIKKFLSSGKRSSIDAAFNNDPVLGFIFLYAYIPNGEAFRNSNTRNLMAQMPAAVQEKAKLQQELWNYLENKSQYGHENFGKLTRNAATKILERSPEQFLSELLQIQLTEGERWWYGSSFPIIRGIGTPWANILQAGSNAGQAASKSSAFTKLTDEAGKLIPFGNVAAKIVQFGAKLFKGLFGKKGVVESAFGIAIPPHLDPAKIGPDFEKDFGFKSDFSTPDVALPPIKKTTTIVDQLLNQVQEITKPVNKEINNFPNDDVNPFSNNTEPPPSSAEENNMTPIYLGGAALAAYFLLK